MIFNSQPRMWEVFQFVQVYFVFLRSVLQVFLNKFIYFWLRWVFTAVHGLSIVAVSNYSLRQRGLLFVAVHGLLTAVASLVVEHGTRTSVVVAHGLSSCGLQALERRLSSCGTQAQLLCGMWDLPGPGLEPMSPALAGRFLTTVPPGKSSYSFLQIDFIHLLGSLNLKYQKLLTCENELEMQTNYL